MACRGYIDKISARQMCGWALDEANPNTPVLVEILAGGGPVCVVRADGYREDLHQAGFGDGCHAFAADLPVGVWGKLRLSARVAGTNYLLIDNDVRNEQRHMERFHHSIVGGLPRPRSGFSRRDMDAEDVTIAREMLEIWRRPRAEAAATGGGIWERHVRDRLGPLRSLLAGTDETALAHYLVTLPMQGATTGIIQGDDAYADLKSTPEERQDIVVVPCADGLLSLAEYLGAHRLESPEQGDLGVAILTPQESLRAACEQLLGHSLVPPGVFDGLFGLKFDDGILHERDVYALYAVLRAIRLASSDAPRLCEIGGGLGQMAFFAWRRGVRHYTIVDLPLVSMMQYFYLRRALPEVRLQVFAEGGVSVGDAPGIHLVWADAFAAPDSPRFDVIVNCDSFPEMGDTICRQYFQALRGRARTLLSINQEAGCPLTAAALGPRQSIVGELLHQTAGYTLVDRIRTWIRKGYAEEVWSIS